jgi:hypothetical protein
MRMDRWPLLSAFSRLCNGGQQAIPYRRYIGRWVARIKSNYDLPTRRLNLALMPFYRFRLDSPLSPEQAERNIALMTGVHPPVTFFAFGTGLTGHRSSAAFFGKVKNYSFNLQRNISYRNSFLPTIRGRIEAAATGAQITVTMFINSGAAVFISFWFSMLFWIAWKFIVVHRQGIPPMFAIIFSFMLVSGLLIVVGGFLTEALTARRLLKSILKATVSHR